MRISKKQFAKELIKTNYNQTQAYKAIRPGATTTTAEQEGRRLANHPQTQKYLLQTLNEQGLDLETSIKALKTALFSGLGKKATNKDSIKALEMILKIHQAKDIDTDTDYDELSHNELMQELRQVKNKLNFVIRGSQEEAEIIEPKQPPPNSSTS